MDGHERPETIAYSRPIFTNKYLSFKLRTHRWIRITKVDSKLLLESNDDIAESCGFYYYTDDGVEMVEYHVDASYKFQDKIDELPFGGNLLSVTRKNLESRPVMFIGQDEAIYIQFLFLSKMWVGPKGKRPLLPKNELPHHPVYVMSICVLCKHFHNVFIFIIRPVCLFVPLYFG